MVKVSHRNTRRRWETCLKLIIKTPGRHNWPRSVVFIVNFEHISHLFLAFLLLTLNREMFYRVDTVLLCWNVMKMVLKIKDAIISTCIRWNYGVKFLLQVHHLKYKSSRSQVFSRITVWKSFRKLPWKHLWRKSILVSLKTYNLQLCKNNTPLWI